MWTGAKIKSLRKRLGETQAEFATHFRLSVESIRMWEQEKEARNGDKGRPGGPATVILDQLAIKASELEQVEQPAA
jgi:DNA-binding transcriptional regulator YiaG